MDFFLSIPVTKGQLSWLCPAGAISDDDWLPWFTCKAVGDVLLETAAAHPDKHFTILCGHTHGSGHVHIRPNLEVHTGGAEYGRPVVQTVFEFGDAMDCSDDK